MLAITNITKLVEIEGSEETFTDKSKKTVYSCHKQDYDYQQTVI